MLPWLSLLMTPTWIIKHNHWHFQITKTIPEWNSAWRGRMPMTQPLAKTCWSWAACLTFADTSWIDSKSYEWWQSTGTMYPVHVSSWRYIYQWILASQQLTVDCLVVFPSKDETPNVFNVSQCVTATVSYVTVPQTYCLAQLACWLIQQTAVKMYRLSVHQLSLGTDAHCAMHTVLEHNSQLWHAVVFPL